MQITRFNFVNDYFGVKELYSAMVNSIKKFPVMERQFKSVLNFNLFLILIFSAMFASAQSDLNNYDEQKIPAYKLPEILVSNNGARIHTIAEWEKIRRPEILKLFTEEMYGRVPGKSEGLHFKVIAEDNSALGGKATRKEITIFFTADENGPSAQMLLWLPNAVSGKVPVMIGLNFLGNHATTNDTTVSISKGWYRVNQNPEPVLRNQWPQEVSWKKISYRKEIIRDEDAYRWPAEEIINAGFGLATMYYEEIEPDNPDGWKSGVRGLLAKNLNIKTTEWGSISAWAWGLSRMVDYLETDGRVNSSQVVVTGLSRLGKTSLWAGANDQRIAMVVSNDSGEGGASLSKRLFGETIDLINNVNPHWFIEKYKSYNYHEEMLPMDQHMLIALAAPRPVYVASAVDDAPADPKGEFLSAYHAAPVYRLYGYSGVVVSDQPAVDHPVGERIGYHVRTGGHDILLYDWQQFIQFAKKHFNTDLTVPKK